MTFPTIFLEDQVKPTEAESMDESAVAEKEQSGSEEDAAPHIPMNVCVSSLLGAGFRKANKVTANYTRAERYRPKNQQTESSKCNSDGDESDAPAKNFTEEENQSEREYGATEYTLGSVSETEVLFVDSDVDVDVKPKWLGKYEVVVIDSESEAEKEMEQRLPVNREVIVIQPDSDLESNPESPHRDNIKMEIDGTPSGGKDSEACKYAKEHNCECICELVSVLVRKGKVNFKTVGKQELVNGAEIGKPGNGNILYPTKKITQGEEDITKNTMAPALRKGKEEKTSPVQSPEIDQNTSEQIETQKPVPQDGIQGDNGMGEAELCEYR